MWTRALLAVSVWVLLTTSARAADRHVYLNTGTGTQLNDCPNPSHNAKIASNTDELVRCTDVTPNKIYCAVSPGSECASWTRDCNIGVRSPVVNGDTVDVDGDGVGEVVYGHPQACVWNMAKSDSCEVHAGTYRKAGSWASEDANIGDGTVASTCGRSNCWKAFVTAFGIGPNITGSAYGTEANPAYLRGAVMNSSTDTWDSDGNKTPDCNGNTGTPVCSVVGEPISYPPIFNGDLDNDGVFDNSISSGLNGSGDAAVTAAWNATSGGTYTGDAFFALIVGCGDTGYNKLCRLTRSESNDWIKIDTNADGLAETDYGVLTTPYSDTSYPPADWFYFKDIEVVGMGGGNTAAGNGIRQLHGNITMHGNKRSTGYVVDHIYVHDNAYSSCVKAGTGCEQYWAIFADQENSGCLKPWEIKNNLLYQNNEDVFNDDCGSGSECGCGMNIHDNRIVVKVSDPKRRTSHMFYVKGIDTIGGEAYGTPTGPKRFRFWNNEVIWLDWPGYDFHDLQSFGNMRGQGLGEFWVYGNLFRLDPTSNDSGNSLRFEVSFSSGQAGTDGAWKYYLFNNSYDFSDEQMEGLTGSGTRLVERNNAYFNMRDVHVTASVTTKVRGIESCTSSGVPYACCTGSGTGTCGKEVCSLSNAACTLSSTTRTVWFTPGAFSSGNPTNWNGLANYVPALGGPLRETGSCDPDGNGGAGVDYDGDGINDTTWRDLAGNWINCSTISTPISIGAIQPNSDTVACSFNCGDGLLCATAGETCDDGTRNGLTACIYGQTSCQICKAGCLTGTQAGTVTYCGDGAVQTGNGETCDPTGPALNGATCLTVGCTGPGTPGCSSGCALTVGTCTACGGGTVTSQGLWVDPAVIPTLPNTGDATTAWGHMKAEADAANATVNLSDQEGTFDTQAFARALVYARTGTASYRTQVVATLVAVQGTEDGSATTLAVCRNLTPLIIAADLIAFAPADGSDEFRSWLSALRTRTDYSAPSQSIVSQSETWPSNQGLHCLASRYAIARYIADTADQARVVAKFKVWLGDRTAIATDPTLAFTFSTIDPSWQSSPATPRGINPLGATITVGGTPRAMDGVIPDDQRRVCDNGIEANCTASADPYQCCSGAGAGLCQFNVIPPGTKAPPAGCFATPRNSVTWPPQRSLYQWGALAPVLTLGTMMDRAGLTDVWTWSDSAIKRAADWNYNTTFAADLGLDAGDGADNFTSGPYYPEDDDEWQPWLLHFFYPGSAVTYIQCSTTSTHGTDCSPTSPGKAIGWTDWTHGTAPTVGPQPTLVGASLRRGAINAIPRDWQYPGSYGTVSIIGPNVAPSMWRPFRPDSPWNTPIAANPTVHADSTTIAKTIAAQSKYVRLVTSYTSPIWYVNSANMTLWSAHGWGCAYGVNPYADCRGSGSPSSTGSYFYRWDAQNSPTAGFGYSDVGIPWTLSMWSEATSDGHVLIVDPLSMTYWELSRAWWNTSPVEPASSTFNRWDLRDTGYGEDPTPLTNATQHWTKQGSRGAGVPALAGMIRPEECDAGEFRHALSAHFNCNMGNNNFVYPIASRSDGAKRPPSDSLCIGTPLDSSCVCGTGAGGVPTGYPKYPVQGMRFQLVVPPGLSLSGLGLGVWGTKVAETLQTYGFYDVENGGGTGNSLAFYASLLAPDTDGLATASKAAWNAKCWDATRAIGIYDDVAKIPTATCTGTYTACSIDSQCTSPATCVPWFRVVVNPGSTQIQKTP